MTQPKEDRGEPPVHFVTGSLPLFVILQIGPLKILLAFILAASVAAMVDSFKNGQVSAGLYGVCWIAFLLWQFIPLRRRKVWMLALLAIAAGWVSPRLRAWVLSWKAPV